MLERKLGLYKDPKRKARNDRQTDMEGFGLGFMSFLDTVEDKVKMSKDQYKVPKDDYKFNNPEFEVAPGESDLSNIEQQKVADDSSNQEGFDDEESEVEDINADESEEEMSDKDSK